jgi:HAD superfamily hydrolase (TIGR01509 family)
MKTSINIVLIDFGGVLAEEGFREGLREIAKQNGLDPDRFYTDADRIIAETGYLTGQANEGDFWAAIRDQTGIKGADSDLRREILRRFVLHPFMLAWVDNVRDSGRFVAILSDQTNWLDEIDENTDLYSHFDAVFNSFHVHKSKRDASLFRDVCSSLGEAPACVLFIDDNRQHIDRASGAGLKTFLYKNQEDFERQIAQSVVP